MLDEGIGVALAFGRLFIANPDLSKRITPLAPDDPTTWRAEAHERNVPRSPEKLRDFGFSSS